MTTRAERRESQSKPLLADNTYDFLKNLVERVLPGLGTLYFTIAQIWGLPYAEQVVGTIAALSLFLGLLLRRSAKSYEASGAAYDGVIRVDETEDGRRVASLILDNYEDPAEIVELDKAVFKVES